MDILRGLTSTIMMISGLSMLNDLAFRLELLSGSTCYWICILLIFNSVVISGIIFGTLAYHIYDIFLFEDIFAINDKPLYI